MAEYPELKRRDIDLERMLGVALEVANDRHKRVSGDLDRVFDIASKMSEHADRFEKENALLATEVAELKKENSSLRRWVFFLFICLLAFFIFIAKGSLPKGVW